MRVGGGWFVLRGGWGLGREVVRDWDGLGWMVGRNRGVTKMEGIGGERRGVKFEGIGMEVGGGGNGLLDWSGGRGRNPND